MKQKNSVFIAAIIAALLATGCSSVVDTTKGQSGTCPRHHISMTRKRVEIAYGLIRFPSPQPPLGLSETDFPFAQDYALGGCIVSSRSPKYADIYVCPACQRAGKKWREAHP